MNTRMNKISKVYKSCIARCCGRNVLLESVTDYIPSQQNQVVTLTVVHVILVAVSKG